MASIYDKQVLSDADLKRIEQLQDEWKKANNQKQKNQIHQKADAIRNSYGYSGGTDGSEFILQNKNALNTGVATSGYTDALKDAQKVTMAQYEQDISDAEKEGQSRLREAYVKNMQDSLGIDQKLRAAGITGGASESTVAYMNNAYNTSRNSILEDTAKTKKDIASQAAKDLYNSNVQIAKAEYDGATARADRITQAEQTAYDRMQDAYERNYQKSVDDKKFANDERDFEYQKSVDERKFANDERDFNYQKGIDERDFEYQKSVDERDFDYKKQTDAYNREQAAKKASSSSSSSSKNSLTVSNVISLIKNGVYDSSFASILGISDAEVRAMVNSGASEDKKQAAWKLLDIGIYDDSFPELLGYSEEILKNYADMQYNGF